MAPQHDDVKSEWVKWINGYWWDYFGTVTSKDQYDMRDELWFSRVRGIIRLSMNQAFVGTEAYQSCGGFTVIERAGRKPHCHFLLRFQPSIIERALLSNWYSRFHAVCRMRSGFGWITRINGKAGSYCCKYINKTDGDCHNELWGKVVSKGRTLMDDKE